ncbi:glycosyltransferase family 2 protein [Candidatus Bathyarchaeota archaeon]|nr:glycosyltransferase family 2 protein [Candidatus Bathyarchaeota archaeon]
MRPRIAVFSSFFNESENIPSVIEAVKNQTLRPAVWVISDDGSTDGSLELLEAHTLDTDWIKVHRLPEKTEYAIVAGRGWRQAIKTVYETGEEYDYYCKMDGDTVLPSDYFERVIGFMEENPEYKVVSGCIHIQRDGEWVLEGRRRNEGFIITENARGMCFLVERELFLSVPFSEFPDVAYDTFYGVKARIRGYKAAQLDVPTHVTRATLVPSPFQRGRMMKALGASPFYVLLMAPWEGFGLGQTIDLFRGYGDLKEGLMKDREVRRYYTAREALRRTATGIR